MPLDQWPETLRHSPLLEGYDVVELVKPPTAFEPEDGPAIERQWSSSNWTRLKMSLQFSKTEVDTFITFYKTTLARGRKRFEMPIGRLSTPSPWPKKVCKIRPGTLQGPSPVSHNRARFSFELDVLGW